MKAKIIGALILIAYSVLVSSVTQSPILILISEAISGLAVIGIAIKMFPLFKSYNKPLTVTYLLGKIIEGAAMIIAGILLILNLTGIRETIYLCHTYIFILSAIIFLYLLYKSKLIPRFISIWGIISVILLLIINIWQTIPLAFLLYLPIMLNEIFLALWLIIRGFNEN